MVGLDLSHTHLLCHILFWLTEMVLFSNVSVYSIITCLDPFLPLYFIRLLGSDFFFKLGFLKNKAFPEARGHSQRKSYCLGCSRGLPLMPASVFGFMLEAHSTASDSELVFL